MAMVGKESLEVDLIRVGVGLFKADGFDEAFGLLIGNITEKERVMHAAEVDEIERTSTEDEESLEVERTLNGREIVEHTALIGELELANADELVVNCCGICKQIGIVLYAAAQADLFLREL